MKSLFYSLMLASLILTGCQSSRPGGSPSDPLRAKESRARVRLNQLEKQLDAHAAAQANLSNAVQKIHADLYAAAQEMRDIKVRANDLSVASDSNRTAMAAIEAEILEQRNVVLQCEKDAMEEARKVAALKDALSAERGARERDATAAEQARQKAVEEESQKAQAVRDALTREKDLRERDQKILREREKQIEDLRLALEERDKLLRAGSAPTAAPAVKPQPDAQSSAASPATNAAAPSAQPDAAANTMHEATRLIAQGNSALRQNKIEDAERAFSAALAISPELVGARIGRAACLYTRGQFDEAKQLVDGVLKEDSRNAQALGLRGLLYWREGDLSEATSVLQRATKQDPTDSQLQNYLGIVLFERKRHDPALDALRKAVMLDPANGEAQFNLAVVLASGSRPNIPEATEHYKAAIDLGSERDPDLDKILNLPK